MWMLWRIKRGETNRVIPLICGAACLGEVCPKKDPNDDHVESQDQLEMEK